MKKVLLTFGFILATTFLSNAQEISNNTIGLNFGSASFNSLGITYQKKLTENSRLQFDVNSNFDNVGFTGSYQRVWVLNEDFNWFAGAGVGFANSTNNLVGLGSIGLDYSFGEKWMATLLATPIQISDDGLNFGSGFGLALRYKF